MAKRPSAAGKEEAHILLHQTWQENGERFAGQGEGRRIITYCAGCANFLDKIGPTAHLLDLLFDPAATLNGKAKVARSPFTYINRLLLKRRFRKKQQYANTRERNLSFKT